MLAGVWIIFKGSLKGLSRRPKQRTEPQVIDKQHIYKTYYYLLN